MEGARRSGASAASGEWGEGAWCATRTADTGLGTWRAAQVSGTGGLAVHPDARSVSFSRKKHVEPKLRRESKPFHAKNRQSSLVHKCGHKKIF